MKMRANLNWTVAAIAHFKLVAFSIFVGNNVACFKKIFAWFHIDPVSASGNFSYRIGSCNVTSLLPSEKLPHSELLYHFSYAVHNIFAF